MLSKAERERSAQCSFFRASNLPPQPQRKETNASVIAHNARIVGNSNPSRQPMNSVNQPVTQHLAQGQWGVFRTRKCVVLFCSAWSCLLLLALAGPELGFKSDKIRRSKPGRVCKRWQSLGLQLQASEGSRLSCFQPSDGLRETEVGFLCVVLRPELSLESALQGPIGFSQDDLSINDFPKEQIACKGGSLFWDQRHPNRSMGSGMGERHLVGMLSRKRNLCEGRTSCLLQFS